MAKGDKHRLSDLRERREAILVNNIRLGFLRKLNEQGLGDVAPKLRFLDIHDPLHERYTEATKAARWVTIPYDKAAACESAARWLAAHSQDIVLVIATPCAALCTWPVLLEQPRLIETMIRHIGLCTPEAGAGWYCGGRGTEEFIVISWPEPPSNYL